MKYMILAAAVALALTGPAQADWKLYSKDCSKLNAEAREWARDVVLLQELLKKQSTQQVLEFDETRKAGVAYENPILEKKIRATKKSLRTVRTAAAEYSTIWRNLCKD